MKRQILLLGVLLLSAVAGADAKTDITAAYKAMDQLFGKRDAAGLQKYMKAHTTADFYSTAAGKKYNLEQNFAQITPLLKQAVTMKRPPTTIYSIDVKGDHATAKLYGEFTATVKGRDGVSHVMAGGGKATDHWVKTKGGWKIEETDSYDNKFTIDGKNPYAK